MFAGCHGMDKMKTPTIEEKICPQCGNEIEIFSTDAQAVCEKCGFVVYNNLQSCVRWCKYAELCVGPELYGKLKAAFSEEKKRERR